MRPIFIGDEVSAAAYRLAGFDARVGAAADAPALWAQALRDGVPLIVITAECAARLPAVELAAAQARLDPVAAVVPDVGARVALPDLTASVQASLGIGA